MTELTTPDKLRNSNEDTEGYLLIVTYRQGVTWTVFAILAMFILQNQLFWSSDNNYDTHSDFVFHQDGGSKRKSRFCSRPRQRNHRDGRIAWPDHDWPLTLSGFSEIKTSSVFHCRITIFSKSDGSCLDFESVVSWEILFEDFNLQNLALMTSWTFLPGAGPSVNIGPNGGLSELFQD